MILPDNIGKHVKTDKNMPNYEAIISELQSKICILETENSRLKALLDQSGIPYFPEEKSAGTNESLKPDPDQGARIIQVPVTRTLANRFFSYFWGRMDVYSKRSQSKKTGKAGYYPQCDNFWTDICPRKTGAKMQCRNCLHRVWTKLKIEQIEAHLRGNKPDGSDVIGIYPLFSDGTCRFLVFDFDNHEKGAEAEDYANTDTDWIKEVDAMRAICRTLEIPILTERSRSGRGAHIWIFFDRPIEASLARTFGFALLDKGAESVNMTSFRYYDRMIPAQDSLSDENSLGNLIALPLQGRALRDGNSAFIDESWNAYPDQWKALFSTDRLTRGGINVCMEKWGFTHTPEETAPEQDKTDSVKPWDKSTAFQKSDISGEMQITLADKIYIKKTNLKPRLQNQIRRMARISNPQFFRNHAMGLSNYANARYIYLGEDEENYISIPRGLMGELTDRCKVAGISCKIDDQRSSGKRVNASFTGELRENQKIAVKELLKYDCGILSAATAFGKTVVCSKIIAEEQVSTLILLESSALIEQWEKALSSFLKIQEELPTYKTKTGRIRTRKSAIGVIRGSKDTSTGIIDIAMAGSLCKNGNFHERFSEYGLVLVDECHHSASDTLRSVLMNVRAKYVYGVTATPLRGDGLEKINYMLLGNVRYRYTSKQRAEEQGIRHLVIPRFTRTVCPHGLDKLQVNDAYKIVRGSEVRNRQIETDVRSCVASGRTPVILTKYKEHAGLLYEHLEKCADHTFLLTGDRTKRQQREIRAEMDTVRPEETMILIATGQLIGEGFDFPRLDTLIMGTPVAWKGIVEQYAGRLNRDYPGKKDVRIYDYVDAHIPVFDRMYVKRLKAYKRIGYMLYTKETTAKQDANSIFDADSYLPVYEEDLKEAEKEIVISSPTLARNKVQKAIALLKERQESGVKITIVTWHPDVYKYGRDENRIELMEDLRNAGFHIALMQNDCERFAVIDNQIVWYGSINLLSKEDIEDSIMRVHSADIAAELLEMTFGKGSDNPEEYGLPIK